MNVETKDNLLYTERQPFPLVLIFTALLVALYIAGNATAVEPPPFYTELRFYLILLVFISPAVFWGTMRTEVTAAGVSIRYGLFGRKKRGIDLRDVRAVQVAVIKWPKDFRFIGVTYGKDTSEIGYFVRYGKGCKLITGYGSVFIGSAQPEKLLAVLKNLTKKS
jgi:hypothetical protein